MRSIKNCLSIDIMIDRRVSLLSTILRIASTQWLSIEIAIAMGLSIEHDQSSIKKKLSIEIAIAARLSIERDRSKVA